MNKKLTHFPLEALNEKLESNFSVDEAIQLKTDKNYITPAGFQNLQEMLQTLLHEDRPAVIRQVAWAASNGDRSENADYQYGKRKLREIEKKIRFLTQRIEKAEIVDNCLQQHRNVVFFGATVTYSENLQHQNSQPFPFSKTALSIQKKQNQASKQYVQLNQNMVKTVTLVGVDEVAIEKNYISWVSPIARALIKSTIGDSVQLITPEGIKQLEILQIDYLENH